jgi:hypothetical protein
LCPQIEDVVQVDVRQERADHRALWRALRRRDLVACLKHASPEPSLDQADDALVADPMFDELDQPVMADRVKERPDVGVEYPSHPPSCDSIRERIQRVVLAAPWTEAIAEAQKLRLVDRRQDRDQGGLDDLVLQSRDAERS